MISIYKQTKKKTKTNKTKNKAGYKYFTLKLIDAFVFSFLFFANKSKMKSLYYLGKIELWINSDRNNNKQYIGYSIISKISENTHIVEHLSFETAE